MPSHRPAAPAERPQRLVGRRPNCDSRRISSFVTVPPKYHIDIVIAATPSLRPPALPSRVYIPGSRGMVNFVKMRYFLAKSSP